MRPCWLGEIAVSIPVTYSREGPVGILNSVLFSKINTIQQCKRTSEHQRPSVNTQRARKFCFEHSPKSSSMVSFWTMHARYSLSDLNFITLGALLHTNIRFSNCNISKHGERDAADHSDVCITERWHCVWIRYTYIHAGGARMASTGISRLGTMPTLVLTLPCIAMKVITSQN
jgi:hypothetical protein